MVSNEFNAKEPVICIKPCLIPVLNNSWRKLKNTTWHEWGLNPPTSPLSLTHYAPPTDTTPAGGGSMGLVNGYKLHVVQNM